MPKRNYLDHGRRVRPDFAKIKTLERAAWAADSEWEELSASITVAYCRKCDEEDGRYTGYPAGYWAKALADYEAKWPAVEARWLESLGRFRAATGRRHPSNMEEEDYLL